MPTVLWLACVGQDTNTVALLLKIEGIKDTPAPDGTTGMVVALANMNEEIISLFSNQYVSEESHVLSVEFLKATSNEDLAINDAKTRQIMKLRRALETNMTAKDLSICNEVIEEPWEMDTM